jgi:hypothetical protein
MINFFRKIRRKLADDNKPLKYMRYAIGEIFLVVIGILIALSINNWNEQRKTKADEIKILINIKKAFLSDLDNQFALMGEYVSDKNKSANFIISHMENNLPFNDSLGVNFMVLSGGGSLNWTPQLTAYKRLEAKGIDIIKNDSLLEALLDIYNLDYPLIQNSFDNYLRNIHDYGRPLSRKKFIVSWNDVLEEALFTPVNYELLFEDVELNNTLRTLSGNSRQIEERMLNAKANVEHVIKMIDDELQHRN